MALGQAMRILLVGAGSFLLPPVLVHSGWPVAFVRRLPVRQKLVAVFKASMREAMMDMAEQLLP